MYRLAKISQFLMNADERVVNSLAVLRLRYQAIPVVLSSIIAGLLSANPVLYASFNFFLWSLVIIAQFFDIIMVNDFNALSWYTRK